MNKQSTEDLVVGEDSLYETVMMDTGHYTLAHTHGMCSPMNEP